MDFWFYGQEAFPTQCFRYNGNSHIRLIRLIMLFSRQRVITRQWKNPEEVQQFFLFKAKVVFIFVTISIQICLHYNCFQEIFSEKYFHSSNGCLPVDSVDFRHLGVSFFLFFDSCTGSSSELLLLAPLLYLYSTWSSPADSNK